ncbi:MFS transporter [Paraburkholderia sp. HP33-1]|uniref:MFS transporter n=1 Tax=Paraburkholderia sp. HP33-1 TaxID=2883243 RepID=UPI001F1A2DEE|nr:MFS transporter [Paraburkholderia sp. HP33-1]
MQVPLDQRGVAPARNANFFHAFILLSTVICGTLAPTVIGPVLPEIQRYFANVPGIETLVPVIVTMPMLVLGVLAVVIGAISDRIGRKRVLVGALVLYALAGTAPLYLDSIYTILASRALVGLAEAAVMTVSTSLIGDYFSGAKRDRYASLQTTFASVSAFTFNLLGGMLGEHGWRTPFAAYALPLLLAPLVQFCLWNPTRMHDGQLTGSSSSADEPDFNGWLLALVCVISFGVGLVFMIVPVHLSFMLVDLGTHAPNEIGMAYAMNSLGVIVGTATFGWVLVSRFGVLQQLLIGTALCGIGFITMGSAHDYASLTLGAAINGAGCGVVLPTVISWGLRSLPFARRGFGTGAFTASQFIGYFCSPLLVMPMVGYWGSRFAVVEGWGFALIALAAVAFVASLRTRNRLKLG